jgi:hypothetical protein
LQRCLLAECTISDRHISPNILRFWI